MLLLEKVLVDDARLCEVISNFYFIEMSAGAMELEKDLLSYL